MIPITYPFDFAQGRLFSQSARKGGAPGRFRTPLWARLSGCVSYEARLSWEKPLSRPASLKATLFLSRSLCSRRADWRSAMMVSNSSSLWGSRAWSQSSRILSSSRRFGTLPPNDSTHGSALCAIPHILYLEGGATSRQVLFGATWPDPPLLQGKHLTCSEKAGEFYDPKVELRPVPFVLTQERSKNGEAPQSWDLRKPQSRRSS